MNFACPIIDDIKIVMVEVASLLIRSHDEMILAFLEEPFGLLVFKQDSAFSDFIQFDDVTWRMWKFLLTCIRDEHSFYRIDV